MQNKKGMSIEMPSNPENFTCGYDVGAWSFCAETAGRSLCCSGKQNKNRPVVRDEHSCQPLIIEEVRRILLEHLNQKLSGGAMGCNEEDG
nr:hypothetical protein [uncultured Desulfobacter sp.]